MNTRNVGNTETKTLYYYHTSISEGNMSAKNDSQYSPGAVQDWCDHNTKVPHFWDTCRINIDGTYMFNMLK